LTLNLGKFGFSEESMLEQIVSELWERVALFDFFQFFGRAIKQVIIGVGVRTNALAIGFDQHGQAFCSDTLNRALHREPRVEDIGAVAIHHFKVRE